MEWNRGTAVIWTIIFIIIGFCIGVIATFKNRDIAYGLVIIWAYTGILIKHISTTDLRTIPFNNKYRYYFHCLIINHGRISDNYFLKDQQIHPIGEA